MIRKRNHILKAALDALPEKSGQLLSTLALLSEAVDYLTLRALNPHLPPEPEKVEAASDPKDSLRWELMSKADKKEAQKQYQAALQRWKEYNQAIEARRHSPEFLAAPTELANTVHDLERRGLLQYDGQARRHDLHPVVRGIAAGRLRPEERDGYGQRLVDHFSRQTHSPYDEAETLEDVRHGLRIVRTLLKMGRYQQAYETLSGGVARALLFNLEAYAETISLFRPFFSQGWATLPPVVNARAGSNLSNDAAFALQNVGETTEALAAYAASLTDNLREQNWYGASIKISNISQTLRAEYRLAQDDRSVLSGLKLATLHGDGQVIFSARFDRFLQLTILGRWTEAKAVWDLLDPMGRDWSRAIYRPGDAEYVYALFCFYQGELREEHLAHAEQVAKAAKSRTIVRSLHSLRGEWHLERGEWALAVESLREAVSMARAVGQTNPTAETQLALAKFQLGQLPDPRREADQLTSAKWLSHRVLADLWLAIGDHEQAKQHALAAYKLAWANGEPYVYRYELNKTRALLEKLCAEIPDLPPYDPAKDEKLPWEDDVATAIEKLRAEKQASDPSQ